MRYPGWSDFLLQTAPTSVRQEIQTQISHGQYEEAAELIAEKRGVAFDDAIEAEFYRPRELNYASAAFCLPRIATGPIVTTNFDNVLERVFDVTGRPFLSVVLGAQGRDFLEAFDTGARTLIKIHGKATNSDTRILTKNEYTNYYCNSKTPEIDYRKPLPRALKTLMSRATFVFVGCSLKRDKYLDVVKAAVKDTDARHYALLPEPSNAAIDQRVRELRGFNIFPIWYRPGHHRDIRKVLEHLANTAGRDSVPYCPTHKGKLEPIQCRLTISLACEDVDCLQSIATEMRVGGKLQDLGGSRFVHFRPDFVGDRPRRFSVIRRGADIALTFFPYAIDHAGRSISETTIGELRNGLAYWPRRRGLGPKILVTGHPIEAAHITLSIAEDNRIYILEILFSQ